jgi:hypothetical protein
VNDIDPDRYDLSEKNAALLLVEEAAQRACFPSKVYSRNIPEIRLLPTVYNWEFSRRHPYYLQYQVLAAFYAGFPKATAEAIGLGDVWRKAECAAATLRNLGCTGPYIDPSHDGRKMTCVPHNHPPFSNPSAHPVSLRDLAICLLLRLPKEKRRAVGRILTGEGWEVEGNPTEGTLEGLAAGVAALKRFDFEKDDLTLDRPIPDLLNISPAASEKGVMDAVRSILRQLKLQLNLPDQRRLPEAQLDEYLQVWDLREGWAAGRYDWSRTMRFQDVAAATSTALGTVKNRYRAAFRYITGQNYSPDMFAALFGPLACQESKWTGWRRSKQRAEAGSPKVVTITGAGGDEEGRGSDLLERPPERRYDPEEYIALKNDLVELDKRGYTAEQIVVKLELKISVEDTAALLEYFRQHGAVDL